jgi:CO dehydrogenase maturation factor
LLGSVNSSRVVVADLEAGIGTLTRLGDKPVDVVLVVVEPTPKSIEVGTRAAVLVRQRSGGRLIILANRVRDDQDLAAVWAAFPEEEVVAIPEDPAIAEADRRGLAPLDLTPEAPAVRALAGLAEHLVPIPG